MRDWREEETWPGFAAGVKPGKKKASRRRSNPEETGLLLEELMALPTRERLEQLQEPRFKTTELFDLLLERGRVAVVEDAARAGELLEAAVELGALLTQAGETARDLEGEGLSRALCLMATVDRIRGNDEIAERTLSRAGHFAVSAPGRGHFAQAYGLLRWDQGRSEEAVCFLQHAIRRFGEGGARREEGSCIALLGLLELEEERISAPFHLKQALRAVREEKLEPGLAAQALLGCALTTAVGGQARKAMHYREQAWKYYGQVASEDALLSVYWLEGRLALELGLLEDGEMLLDSVRTKMIEKSWLVEATLSSIDLGLLWFIQGRPGELMRLHEDLTALQNVRGFELARRTLGLFADEASDGRLEAPVWQASASTLRLAFRLQGVRTRPVPFA